MYCEMQPRGRKTLVVRHRIPSTSILVVGPRPYSMINIPSQQARSCLGRYPYSLHAIFSYCYVFALRCFHSRALLYTIQTIHYIVFWRNGEKNKEWKKFVMPMASSNASIGYNRAEGTWTRPSTDHQLCHSQCLTKLRLFSQNSQRPILIFPCPSCTQTLGPTALVSYTYHKILLAFLMTFRSSRPKTIQETRTRGLSGSR